MPYLPFLFALLASGWTPLFDGHSRAGWLEITGAPFPSASWKVENGCLAAILNSDGVQDIRTEAEFVSFELEFEWRIAPGGNSGVKYLLHKTDRWPSRTGSGYHARARGLEYQIADDARNDDAQRNPASRSGGLYGIFRPAGAASRPAGELNRSRIVVSGGHVEHWLNGVQTASFDLKALETSRFPTRAVRPSPIALQNHNSEVCFESIRIRRLD